MIKFINSWAQGIILAVIIATIIEMILPEGNNKKYVKVVIGIYILFSIVYPLITNFTNKNININSIIADTSKKMSEYENNNSVSIETNSYIEKTYKQKLEEDIKHKLEEKGYELLKLDLNIEIENESRYGEINTMCINLKKLNNQKKYINNVDEIQKITINTSNSSQVQDAKQNDDILEQEINDIKVYLKNTYSIDTEKIHINE